MSITNKLNASTLKMIGAALGILIIVLYTMAYTVDQRERAIKFRFREIVESNIEPGLHFRFPLIEQVAYFPAQILSLESSSERFLTSEKKYVQVDFFVKWRIEDVGKFYRSTGGGRMQDATNRLEDIMKDGLRNEFSKRTIEEALSAQRAQIMQGLKTKSNDAAQELGIEVVDVRVSKIDFPDQVSESVYERMRSERKRVAQDFRSRGKEEAEKIQAAADRESTIILAQAYRDAERVRGEGDAKAAEIYAKAYQADAAFYSFYRSLQAYRSSLGDNSSTMILDPNADFFRYLKQPQSNAVAAQ
ncbi:MAG: protease modulator HflC [Thiofilum sp.]|uniref:protease modulator HflC n=1 Tax=Thiofilum sp. TaxID=2212733 RepID=UPI0025ECE325|nr:protease modulator HflC [Thiofilum sp.]MBK8454924.1 protease modulator HflC [Thiofilum sp.]